MQHDYVRENMVVVVCNIYVSYYCKMLCIACCTASGNSSVLYVIICICFITSGQYYICAFCESDIV